MAAISLLTNNKRGFQKDIKCMILYYKRLQIKVLPHIKKVAKWIFYIDFSKCQSQAGMCISTLSMYLCRVLICSYLNQICNFKSLASGPPEVASCSPSGFEEAFKEIFFKLKGVFKNGRDIHGGKRHSRREDGFKEGWGILGGNSLLGKIRHFGGKFLVWTNLDQNY